MIASIPETAAVLEEYWPILYEANDVVEVRRLLRKGKDTYPKGSIWSEVKGLAGRTLELLKCNQSWDIYIGLNPRKAKGVENGRDADKAEDVALARCLCADVDDLPPGADIKEGIMGRVTDAGLPDPSLIVFSGHGGWVYWRLTEPMYDLALWTLYQKRLIDVMGSDQAIHDPPRITRLPGFFNHKPPKDRARIITRSSTRCDLDVFDSVLPPIEEVEAARGKSASTKAAKGGGPTNGKFKYGTQHKRLLSLAGAMRRHGAEESTIHAALISANRSQCERPGPDKNMERMARSVCKYPRGDMPETPAVSATWTCMKDVKAEEPIWLWNLYIPREEITNLIGMGSAGKSTLTAYIAGRVTTGKPFHMCADPVDRGSVLIIVDEESKHKGVRPKLDANCADPSKVYYLDGLVTPNGQPDYFDVTLHCSVLREKCKELGDVRLIVIDPITAYLGNTNANSNNEVRKALLPIQRVAREYKLAVVCINHFNKKEDLDVSNRGLGSVGFRNAARSQIIVHREKDKEGRYTGRRLIGLDKVNDAKDENIPTLAYYIENRSVCFEAKPDVRTISAIVKSESGARRGAKPKQKSDEFANWLLDKKKKGEPVLSSEALAAAEALNVPRTSAYHIAQKNGFDTNSRNNFGTWVYIGKEEDGPSI